VQNFDPACRAAFAADHERFGDEGGDLEFWEAFGDVFDGEVRHQALVRRQPCLA
jgi:hypothetical protein